MWEIELACEPRGPLVPNVRPALEDALASTGMDVQWDRRVLRLRFVMLPRECIAALGTLSRYLAEIGLPVRLYQINAARPPAAAARHAG